MAGSRYFNGAGARPIRQHILAGAGRGREIRDVRADVESAFSSVEAEVDADRARLTTNEADIVTNAADIAVLSTASAEEVVWAAQTTWYISELTGDDSNDGAASITPLASWAEFKRRIEKVGVFVAMTVNVMDDLTATVATPATLSARGGGSITLVGTPTTVETGTVNTWSFDPATNDHGTLNDAAWTVATHLHRYVEFTSGAANGYGCFVAEDLGGSSARVSIVHQFTFGWGATATPAPGDTFKVETFPIIKFGTISFANFYMKKIETSQWNNWQALVFYGQNFGAVACRLNAYIQGQAYLQITNCIGGFSGRGGGGELYGGIYGRLYFDKGRPYTQDGEPVIYDTSIPQSQAMDLGPGAEYVSSWKDFWFMTGSGATALYVENGARFDIGGARIRGDSNPTRLIDVYEGGRFLTTKLDHTVVEKTIRFQGADYELNTDTRFGGDPRASVGDWFLAEALYVNKSGLDTNTGANPGRAFLTIGAAIAKALTLTPAAGNRIAIYVDDAGSYVEDLVVPEWVGIIGHAALIQGNHTIADNALIEAFRLTAPSGVVITKSAGTGAATITCERMVLSGSANGVVCNSGTINYYGQSAEVENGICVGDGSTANINADINNIKITGSGYGVGMTSSGHMHFTGSIDGVAASTGIHVAGTAAVDCMLDHLNIPGGTAYFVDTNASLSGLFASITGTRTGTGTRNITVAGERESQTQEVTWSLPLTGVVDAEFNFLGEFRTITSGEVGDYATDFPAGNNHLGILVNSYTGDGTLRITGTSISESSAVPDVGDTEDITIDATGRYQSSKKWLEVTNIQALGLGITAIDYDVELIGYPDQGNTDFRIAGIRMECFAAGVSARVGFNLWKVQDDGDKKCTLVLIESMGVSETTTEQVDSKRAGARDFTATGSIWLNNTNFTFKQTDYDTYFVAGETSFESSTKDEGYILQMRGEDGSGGGTINQVDFVVLFLRIGPRI
jgi:hypothetical protein